MKGRDALIAYLGITEVAEMEKDVNNCGSNEGKPLEEGTYQEPKYQIGQRVLCDYGSKGRVIRITHMYHVEDDNTPGYTDEYEEDEVTLLEMTEAEVWIEAVLLVHRLVELGEFETVGQDKGLRHLVYQYIGGQGVKVTNDMRGDYGKVQRIIDHVRQQRVR